MRYPFMNFFRYAQLILGMLFIILGFFAALNIAFAGSEIRAFMTDNYLQLVFERALSFSGSYFLIVFIAVSFIATGDFFKLMMHVEDHLRSMRNDSQALVGDENVREELVRSEVYAPLPPRWYERVGDAILARVNAGLEEESLNDLEAEIHGIGQQPKSKLPPPQQPTQAKTDLSQQRTQPVKTIDNTAQKAEAAQHAYNQGVRAYRQGMETKAIDDFNRAHALFEQALSIDPDHAKAREGLRATRKKLSTL